MAAKKGQYAFMDCVDFKLYPAEQYQKNGVNSGLDEQAITINYLNSSQLTLESEAQYAKVKGNNAVTFSGSRTGTFVCGAECIGLHYLAMITGGTLDAEANKITITGDAVTKGYALEGTFRGKERGSNKDQTFKIVLYNVVPQPAVDMTLDATSIGSFDLTFDVLVDAENEIGTIEAIG